MYEQFYGLKDKPFSMLPDPEFLYLSKKHQAALTLLEYGLMNNVGFCVVSGETGAGKTTVLRTLLNRIDDSYRVGMITNTHQSFGSLLDWILSAFNQHEKGLSHVEMHQKLMDFLIAEYGKNRKVLLIVDEAQNMNAETLEELRMLSNVNSDKDQLMQVILAGQPGLKETLRIPELMQFAQRIGVDYHLGDLNVAETTNYIQHRLRTAGATHDIFTAAACARIHSYSGGTPRLVNLLCDTVMVYGFADQLETIDVDLIDEMVLERMKDSVVPLVNRDSPTIYNEDELEKLENDFPSIKEQIEAEKIAKEAMAREDAAALATEKHKVEAGTADITTSPTSQQVDDSTSATPNSATSAKPVNNTVEIEQSTSVAKSDNKLLYVVITVLLLLIIFFVLQSDFVLSKGSENTAVRVVEKQAILDETLMQAEREKTEVIKKARQEGVNLAAEEVEKRLKSAALEQRLARELNAADEQKHRIEAERLKAQKIELEARKAKNMKIEKQRLAKLEAEKRLEREALEAQAIEAKLEAQKLAAQKQQALREPEKAAVLAKQKLEEQRIEAELFEAKQIEREHVEAEPLAENQHLNSAVSSEEIAALNVKKKQKSLWTLPV